MSVASIIFNLVIAVYIYDGIDKYNKLITINEINEERELMILSFHNNNHFDLLYGEENNNRNSCIADNIESIKLNKNKQKEPIKISGIKLYQNYVETNFTNTKNLYDEISEYLKSIQKNSFEIEQKQKENPRWHYNQILSLFDIHYPERMRGRDKSSLNKKKLLEKLQIIIN